MEALFRERLDTVLIRRGISTHRRVRRLLQRKSVTVNGTRIFDCAHPISLSADTIAIESTDVPLAPDIYLMMNKGPGTICSRRQDKLYKTVYECIPRQYFACAESSSLGSLHTAGRLDADTEGLLLFTTNGSVSHALTSPQFHVKKTYRIQLENPVSAQEQAAFSAKCKAGFFIPAEKNEKPFVSLPARLEWISPAECILTITEGKFHQVKRMIASLGGAVSHLQRIAIGSLFLDCALRENECRPLSDAELLLLFAEKGRRPS